MRELLATLLLVSAALSTWNSAYCQTVGSTLQTFGYDRSQDGVARCLADMVWTPEREAEFEQSVTFLDADEFVSRDHATATLIRMAALPHQQLFLELERADLTVEKRRRIYQILNHNTELRRELLLYLAANAISTEGYRGLAAGLLHAANSVPVTQRGVWDAVRTAIIRTVGKDDAKLLQTGVTLPEATARALACEGLAAIEGSQALPHLRPLLQDPDPRVRFHAALVFSELGSHECLSAFISLLDTALPEAYQKHDTHIRFNSVNMLKKLTGQRFGYRAGFAPDLRQPYIEQWKTWLKENGATATLDFSGV